MDDHTGIASRHRRAVSEDQQHRLVSEVEPKTAAAHALERPSNADTRGTTSEGFTLDHDVSRPRVNDLDTRVGATTLAGAGRQQRHSGHHEAEACR